MLKIINNYYTINGTEKSLLDIIISSATLSLTIISSIIAIYLFYRKFIAKIRVSIKSSALLLKALVSIRDMHGVSENEVCFRISEV